MEVSIHLERTVNVANVAIRGISIIQVLRGGGGFIMFCHNFLTIFYVQIHIDEEV